MNKIITKKYLNDSVVMMDVLAPLVAKKAQAGQFVILRVCQNGERIPLTVAGFDIEKGTVKIIFQIVGATTKLLEQKNVGDFICDFVGPLGVATKTEGLKNVCVVGGGVGCAIALPVCEKLFKSGAYVTSIIGFRNKDLIILEDEFIKNSNKNIVTTDDGSYGINGNVCTPLEEMLQNGQKFDNIFAIGPIIMMKFVVECAKKYNIPCTVSMNPIMIDGTGMCGCCRLQVNGETKFACVDGPDFNGYDVNFDEMLLRNNMYKDFEKKAYDEACNLFKKEIN